MSELRELLAAAFPGVTLYAVLVTFGVIALRVMGSLRREEQEVRERLLPKVRLVYEHNVRSKLEPLVEETIRQALVEAYVKGVGDAFLRVEQTIASLGLSDQDAASVQSEVRAYESGFSSAAPGAISTFLASFSGAAFADKLEAGYATQHRVLARYHALKAQDRLSQGSLCCLAIVFFAGLLSLLSETIPIWLSVGYVYLAVVLSAATLVAVVRREQLMRELGQLYEDYVLASGVTGHSSP